jgi:hypothetical protein
VPPISEGFGSFLYNKKTGTLSTRMRSVLETLKPKEMLAFYKFQCLWFYVKFLDPLNCLSKYPENEHSSKGLGKIILSCLNPQWPPAFQLKGQQLLFLSDLSSHVTLGLPFGALNLKRVACVQGQVALGGKS